MPTTPSTRFCGRWSPLEARGRVPEMQGTEIMRLAIGAAGLLQAASAHAASLPRYDHIVIVVEENKDYEEIIRNKDVPFLNRLAEEGASLTQMFAEEHPSQGNYFWLFAGSCA